MLHSSVTSSMDEESSCQADMLCITDYYWPDWSIVSSLQWFYFGHFLFRDTHSWWTMRTTGRDQAAKLVRASTISYGGKYSKRWLTFLKFITLWCFLMWECSVPLLTCNMRKQHIHLQSFNVTYDQVCQSEKWLQWHFCRLQYGLKKENHSCYTQLKPHILTCTCVRAIWEFPSSKRTLSSVLCYSNWMSGLSLIPCQGERQAETC